MTGEIELSPRAIEIIEDFLGYKSNNNPGMERYCQGELLLMCNKVFDERCVHGHLKISLKGQPFQMNEFDRIYDHYFQGSSMYRFSYERRCGYGYKYFLRGKCERYFEKNAHSILIKYIASEYGNMETAILQNDCFVELFDKFLSWFEDRRKEFMEKMEIDIAKVKEVALSRSGKPQSHGGGCQFTKGADKDDGKTGFGYKQHCKGAVCSMSTSRYLYP